MAGATVDGAPAGAVAHTLCLTVALIIGCATALAALGVRGAAFGFARLAVRAGFSAAGAVAAFLATVVPHYHVKGVTIMISLQCVAVAIHDAHR